jgi:hypothetical protein
MEMVSEGLYSKWSPILENKEFDPIKGKNAATRKRVTAAVLENTQRELAASRATNLFETPANAAGGALGANASDGSAVAGYDPILMSMLRRSVPNLLAYDICGVQAMTGPTGLIFAMRSNYSSQGGTEALYNEADTDFSGFQDETSSSSSGTHAGSDPTNGAYTTGDGMSIARAEALGSTGATQDFNEMAFSIEKVTVTAKSRALKAEYTTELAQDLKAVHGLDAETELANILTQEILAEINREVVRKMYTIAKPGAQVGVTSTGTVDLDQDTNGRWSVERWKGLVFNIQRDLNDIAKDTRRGKGNFIVTSSDVAAALHLAGVLDYAPAFQTNELGDDTGATYVGNLHGNVRVIVDPYFSASSTTDFYCAGYKGSDERDAGLFYCPYVPLQMVRAVGENNFQPKIAFKTRYGLVTNPFANATAGTGELVPDSNKYYRFTIVDNLS